MTLVLGVQPTGGLLREGRTFWGSSGLEGATPLPQYTLLGFPGLLLLSGLLKPTQQLKLVL